MRFGFVCVYKRLHTPVANILYCSLFLILGTSFSAWAQQPVINTFSPTTACQGGTVTIMGSGFTGATSVRLGTLNAARFTVQDDNTIVAVVADYSISGIVTVTTNNGSGNGPGTLTIQQAPKPGLFDISTADAQFTN
jgi:large repetitive protein